MEPGREMSLRRDRAGWFSANHRSIARHDRPAERTHTPSFRRYLLECLIEILSDRVVRRLLVRGEGRHVRRPDFSTPSVSIAGNSQRGLKRRE